MSEPVTILGLGAEGPAGLAAHLRATIAHADFIAGGRRHLRLLGTTAAVSFEIADNVAELVRRLSRRGDHERCVVLASGDPLFYGIGRTLCEQLGRDRVIVIPSISSMQLAFARVGLAWQDAAIGSVHGRPLKAALLPLLGRRAIGLFTADGNGPSEIARFFIERDLPDYDAWVCQQLGSAEESVVHLTLPNVANERFADLNVLLMRRQRVADSGHTRDDPANVTIEDRQFERPATESLLLTHQDVRALVLRRFDPTPQGPIWDIGAGLGGVSVELARAFPDREVVAVERSSLQSACLRTNRLKFGGYNIRVLEGEAPDCVEGEVEPPAGVFLGGSGGRLGPIMDLVADRLVPQGVFVANFVGLENLTSCVERLRALGWREDLAQIQVSHARPLAGLTTFVPQRPVWILRAIRAEPGAV